MSLLVLPDIPFGDYARLAAGVGGQPAWKASLERMIDRANFAFRLITDADAAYHSAIFKGVDPSPEMERGILAFYRQWLGPADDVIGWIEELESSAHAIAGADEFRRNVSAARGVTMEGSEFFDFDSLAVLSGRAIVDHREGRTAEFDGTGN